MSTPSPGLIPFLARNAAFGILTGWAVLGALLVFDVARLRELLFESEHCLLTLILAAGGFGLTFGSLAMGTAVFLLPKE